MNYTSMRKRNFMIWFMMLGLYFSCAGPGQSPQRTGRGGAEVVEYREDLSSLRNSEAYKTATVSAPAVNTLPERPQGAVIGALITNQDVTTELDTLLAASAERNEEIKFIPGFTIQVYLGTSREGANTAKRQVYEALPDAPSALQPEIRFVQPNYRVLVGRFVDRLEAQKTYADLKQAFPNALVIPDRIQINN